MKLTKLTYQQKQWIRQAYADIVESPESYGIRNFNNETNEVVELIKEDTDKAFGCKIDLVTIKEILINEKTKCKNRQLCC